MNWIAPWTEAKAAAQAQAYEGIDTLPFGYDFFVQRWHDTLFWLRLFVQSWKIFLDYYILCYILSFVLSRRLQHTREVISILGIKMPLTRAI